MDDNIGNIKHGVALHMKEAQQALDAAKMNLRNEFYATAINRAYYSIFYASSGLLCSKNIQRAKHSGVVSTFRKHFVKAGIIEPEYSDIYGDVMDARVDSDYDMTLEADLDTAQECVRNAEAFLDRIKEHLEAEKWL